MVEVDGVGDGSSSVGSGRIISTQRWRSERVFLGVYLAFLLGGQRSGSVKGVSEGGLKGDLKGGLLRGVRKDSI